VLRFPKTPLGSELPAARSADGVDVLSESAADPAVDVLLVSVGAVASDVVAAADQVRAAGRSVRVVDPRWVQPLPSSLGALARSAGLVVTVEDGVVSGGVGARVSQLLRAAGIDTPTREIGIPARFLDHGKVTDVREQVGITAEPIATRVLSWCDSVLGPLPSSNGDLSELPGSVAVER
jgi:1-deoxy-D-xylulose-5-phosphate synthase